MGILSKILPASASSITQDDLKEFVKFDPKVMIIDVRTMAEYRMEHINPCQNLSVREGVFDDQVKYLDKQGNYVLYCRTERRSKAARKKMRKLGFKNVFTLKGGIQKWVGSKKVK